LCKEQEEHMKLTIKILGRRTAPSTQCFCRAFLVEGREHNTYRARRARAPRGLVHQHQLAHQHKDEVIVSATQAIIARVFVVITPYRRTNKMYYLSFCERVIAQPQELTLGGGAGAASGDDGRAAAPLLPCFGLRFTGGAFRALRLPL
jgi:hypothetical protein